MKARHLTPNESESQFWLVWTPEGSVPTRKHVYADSAIAEAERLARQNPERTFYVLLATDARKVTQMVKTVLAFPDEDEVPF